MATILKNLMIFKIFKRAKHEFEKRGALETAENVQYRPEITNSPNVHCSSDMHENFQT